MEECVGRKNLLSAITKHQYLLVLFLCYGSLFSSCLCFIKSIHRSLATWHLHQVCMDGEPRAASTTTSVIRILPTHVCHYPPGLGVGAVDQRIRFSSYTFYCSFGVLVTHHSRPRMAPGWPDVCRVCLTLPVARSFTSLLVAGCVGGAACAWYPAKAGWHHGPNIPVSTWLELVIMVRLVRL